MARLLLGPLRGPHRHRAGSTAHFSSGRGAARIVVGLLMFSFCHRHLVRSDSAVETPHHQQKGPA
jgi:hypothetical protein